MVYSQRCHDYECASYRSNEFALPARLDPFDGQDEITDAELLAFIEEQSIGGRSSIATSLCESMQPPESTATTRGRAWRDARGGGDGGGGGALDDESIALEHSSQRVGGLLERDDERAGEQGARVRPHVGQHRRAADAVDE
jgi:hypothetical protein